MQEVEQLCGLLDFGGPAMVQCKEVPRLPTIAFKLGGKEFVLAPEQYILRIDAGRQGFGMSELSGVSGLWCVAYCVAVAHQGCLTCAASTILVQVEQNQFMDRQYLFAMCWYQSRSCSKLMQTHLKLILHLSTLAGACQCV